MSAVSYEPLLLTHVSGAAWSYPGYKLSTMGGAGRETGSAEPLFKGYFRFSGHCFAVVFFPSNIKTHCQAAIPLGAEGEVEVHCAVAEVAPQVHSDATDQQTEPLGFRCFCWCWVVCWRFFVFVVYIGFDFFFSFSFCDWDVTKKSP